MSPEGGKHVAGGMESDAAVECSSVFLMRAHSQRTSTREASLFRNRLELVSPSPVSTSTGSYDI